jgi:hypothetical protein
VTAVPIAWGTVEETSSPTVETSSSKHHVGDCLRHDGLTRGRNRRLSQRPPAFDPSSYTLSGGMCKRGKTSGGMILRFSGGRESDSFWGCRRPGDLDGLSHAELKGLVVRQWEEMVELQRMVAALREEIARLKGGRQSRVP